MREVEMAQPMTADLEIGIGNQLLGALFVGLHPFAAGEERSLHALGAEKVDDPPVIACDVAVGLAEIEGECDELLAGWKLDTPDRAAQLLWHRCGRGKRLLLERWGVEMEVGPARSHLLPSASQSLRRPALLEQALILRRSTFEPARS